MKTRQQKEQELSEQGARLAKYRTLVFVDFFGTPARDITFFRQTLKSLNSEFKVSKKRLLRLAFTEKKIALNPEDFPAQLGVIFSPLELTEIAAPIFKFSREHEKFSVLGGYDLGVNSVFSPAFVEEISRLPSREVLLEQLVGMIAAPLKMFMLTLKEYAAKLETVS